LQSQTVSDGAAEVGAVVAVGLRLGLFELAVGANMRVALGGALGYRLGEGLRLAEPQAESKRSRAAKAAKAGGLSLKGEEWTLAIKLRH
jgi:hypothetical protein